MSALQVTATPEVKCSMKPNVHGKIKHLYYSKRIVYHSENKRESKGMVQLPKSWMVEKIKTEGKAHRTLEDIAKPLKPTEAWDMIHAKAWPYKVNMDKLIERDTVLIDILYAVAPRISEALKLQAGQFDIFDSEDFLIIRNLQLVKRKKLSKKGHGLKGPKFRIEVPLPRRGPLTPFTAEIESYILKLPNPEAYLFPKASQYNGDLDYSQPMNRRRAWAIVKYVTGQWPHFFRSQGETYYAKVFRSAWALKDFMGLTDTKTLDRYVKTDWRDYEPQLLGHGQ